jgi:hypothetical protein
VLIDLICWNKGPALTLDAIKPNPWDGTWILNNCALFASIGAISIIDFSYDG